MTQTLALPPPLPPDYPRDFRALLWWMLRPNPAIRITAAAALARLEALAAGRRMVPMPETLLQLPDSLKMVIDLLQ
jgi:serine/threonine protein kinase